MINKLIKKIWFICLWFTSLTLAGCFHVPDEDWLLSDNNTETWNLKNEEMDEVLNSFMEWINMISSGWNNLNNKNDEINTDDWSENTIEIEDNASNEEMIDSVITTDNETENKGSEEDVIPEE